MNLAAALISPANASEVFPDAPRPLVSASSKELHPLSSVSFITKERRARHWGPGLCAQGPRAPRGPLCAQGTRGEGDNRHRGTDCTQGPCLCFLGAGEQGQATFLDSCSLLLNHLPCSPKGDLFVTRLPDSEDPGGEVGLGLSV